MSSVLDYADRRFDILAFRGAVAQGDVQLAQSLFGADSSGEICTGVQKLAQRWVLEFLTEIGSMRFRAQRGCQFMTDVRQGRLRTERQVITSFNFSMLDVQVALGNEETEDMPDDERYARATLDAIAILPGFLQMTVSIYSRAGLARKVILPIATTV